LAKAVPTLCMADTGPITDADGSTGFQGPGAHSERSERARRRWPVCPAPLHWGESSRKGCPSLEDVIGFGRGQVMCEAHVLAGLGRRTFAAMRVLAPSSDAPRRGGSWEMETPSTLTTA
jgi:hypothetical protein